MNLIKKIKEAHLDPINFTTTFILIMLGLYIAATSLIKEEAILLAISVIYIPIALNIVQLLLQSITKPDTYIEDLAKLSNNYLALYKNGIIDYNEYQSKLELLKSNYKTYKDKMRK